MMIAMMKKRMVGVGVDLCLKGGDVIPVWCMVRVCMTSIIIVMVE